MDKECLSINRNQAIRLSYREKTVDELVKTAVESRSMFFDGGGVTISGGEATVQFDGLKSLLEGLGKEGIHRALETNGSHKNLNQLFPLTDLLIFDIKHWNFNSVRRILKNEGTHVIENLRAACQSGIEILLRITVIPGFNSSRHDMEMFSDFIASLSRNEQFRLELLYYHTYGKSKWEAIGQKYCGPDSEITEIEKEQYKEIFESHGLNLIST